MSLITGCLVEKTFCRYIASISIDTHVNVNVNVTVNVNVNVNVYIDSPLTTTVIIIIIIIVVVVVLRFEILTAVLLKVGMFCLMVSSFGRFERFSCLIF
jgi:hypothetical protein